MATEATLEEESRVIQKAMQRRGVGSKRLVHEGRTVHSVSSYQMPAM